MINRELFNKWLEETKNNSINVAWLDIALNATNASGVISKQIDPDKFYSTNYPDVIQEIQVWLANIIVSKRLSIIKNYRVHNRILLAIKELEKHPNDIVRIFYKYRYIYKKPHTQIKINTNESQNKEKIMQKTKKMVEQFEKSPKTLAFWLWIGQVSLDRDNYISEQYPEETENIKVFLSRCLDLKQTALTYPNNELQEEEKDLLDAFESFVNNTTCDVIDIYQIYQDYKHIFDEKTRNLTLWLG